LTSWVCWTRWISDHSTGGWYRPKSASSSSVSVDVSVAPALYAGEVGAAGDIFAQGQVAQVRSTGLPVEGLGGIVRLYVDPHFQRLGLARALLDTAADAAAEHNLKPVLDVVDDSGPAIALYERAGWKLVGTQPATWTDPDGSVPVIRCYVRP
jgi:ribosomal protein S18 acetylase RimI-like enzyme